MLEAADCYRRLGRKAQEQRLLERAAKRKGGTVAAQARKMLAQPAAKAALKPKAKAKAAKTKEAAAESTDSYSQ